MQSLKVKLYQEVAVYRNPITMEVIESFPLPPPSTVLGLVQSLLAEREPIRFPQIHNHRRAECRSIGPP